MSTKTAQFAWNIEVTSIICNQFPRLLSNIHHNTSFCQGSLYVVALCYKVSSKLCVLNIFVIQIKSFSQAQQMLSAAKKKAKTIGESQHKKSFKKTHQRQWMNEDYNVYAMMNFQTCNLLEKNRKTKIIQGNISYISSDNGLY